MKSIEYERKYEVDPKLLPEMPEPWVFIQGYAAKGDLSERVIPACNTSFGRVKDVAFGIRAKDSRRHSLQRGVNTLMSYPLAVVKQRHIFSNGRVWLIDYLPEADVWHAETEFDTPEQFWEGPDESPNWLGRELTWSDEGYTKNFATPHSLDELRSLINYAQQTGCATDYDPDTIFKAQ